jgi:wyosine [tRNA(Phe)-imidazoG37] synthetase (radical SAM superfamily)
VALTHEQHDRDSAGLTYVYPVLSRRSGGLSLGINLNPNQACNFRCVYCQVPGLVRGRAPAIDLELLERELDSALEALERGDLLPVGTLPAGLAGLRDLALSGDGEPTSAREFEDVVALLLWRMERVGLAPDVPLVLITNGSLVRVRGVQRGLARLGRGRGRVWFKLDSATEEGRARINGWRASNRRVLANLATCAALCPTWLQTCVFAWDGAPPSREERDAYLEFVAALTRSGVRIEGVLLYGLARPSHQPEAPRLGRLPAEWLEGFASEIRERGLPVEVWP